LVQLSTGPSGPSSGPESVPDSGWNLGNLNEFWNRPR
jgi:hypothetical protein